MCGSSETLSVVGSTKCAWLEARTNCCCCCRLCALHRIHHRVKYSRHFSIYKECWCLWRLWATAILWLTVVTAVIPVHPYNGAPRVGFQQDMKMASCATQYYSNITAFHLFLQLVTSHLARGEGWVFIEISGHAFWSLPCLFCLWVLLFWAFKTAWLHAQNTQQRHMAWRIRSLLCLCCLLGFSHRTRLVSCRALFTFYSSDVTVNNQCALCSRQLTSMFACWNSKLQYRVPDVEGFYVCI